MQWVMNTKRRVSESPESDTYTHTHTVQLHSHPRYLKCLFGFCQFLHVNACLWIHTHTHTHTHTHRHIQECTADLPSHPPDHKSLPTPSRCSASPRQKDPSRRLFQHRHRCRCSRGCPSQPFCHRFCSRGWYQDPEPIRQGHVGSCSQLTLH